MIGSSGPTKCEITGIAVSERKKNVNGDPPEVKNIKSDMKLYTFLNSQLSDSLLTDNDFIR